MIRAVLLRVSESHWLAQRATKYGFMRRAVGRFMPGERLGDALAAATALSGRRISSILTQLGENVPTEAAAGAVADHYVHQIDSIAAYQLDAEPSVKLTQLGLDLGTAICQRNLARILARAAEADVRVWIDMEASAYTDRTLAIFREARLQHAKTGVCLQAYLYRTATDLDALLAQGATIRLVKGAYKESPHRAYARKADVDRNFLNLTMRFLEPDARKAGARLSVASHDTTLIRQIAERMTALDMPASSVEFQFLYGIRSDFQDSLAASGHSVRVLISYGSAWFPWFVRRLAERPANLTFVLRHLVHG
jgi:proline dehydrogenase